MDEVEVQSGIPVQRFYRAINCGGVFIQDLPFDEAEHDWPVPVDDSSIVQQSGGTPYSLAQCYEFIEDGLLANDGRLVKEAVRKVLKSSDNIVINSLQITQIQAGAQQGIFKVDCKISADRAVGADGGLLEDVSTAGGDGFTLRISFMSRV